MMNQQVVVAEEIDVHKSIQELHETYREALKQTSNDCEELFLYNRYVRDISEVLQNCMKCYERDERQMKDFYEKQVSDLILKLERSRLSNGDPGADDLHSKPAFNSLLIDTMKSKSVGDNTNKMSNTSPDDLRHENGFNDLQSTCRVLTTEKEKLRVENEALKSKLKSMEHELTVLKDTGGGWTQEKKILESKVENLKSELKTERNFKKTSFANMIEAGRQKKTESDSSGDSFENHGNISIELTNKCANLQVENQNLQEKLIKAEQAKDECQKKLHQTEKSDFSDTRALILEIADKHDHISCLRNKNRKLQERVEQLERKVQFREKIICELRRMTKCQVQSISPYSLTPPRTPELKATESCSVSDLEMYRSNFLTVPGQPLAKVDSCFSLYDLDQESNMGKSASETNFRLCFDDANRDEIERLHHMINEMESENGCNRLLITKLEDELMMIRKSETRAKQDRDLKSDKLRVLRYKVKTIGYKVLAEKSGEVIEKPRLQQSEMAVLEDELKPEYDILNNIVKIINTTKGNLEKCLDENRNLFETMNKLRSELHEASNQDEVKLRVSPDIVPDVTDKKKTGNLNFHRKVCESIASVLSEMLGKEIQAEAISELSSSSPESAESSLSNGHSLSDVISDWKRELEEKNCLLRDKISMIHSLEDQLKHKDLEICDILDRCKSVELDRDKNCQMVSQLKSAIQIHNESIQYINQQNAELRHDLDENKLKLEKHHEYYNEMKKRNLDLESENNNLHLTITNMRSTIEDLKRGNSVSGKSHRSLVTRLFKNVHDV